jgi:glycolate oxidase FAD binding subunit
VSVAADRAEALCDAVRAAAASGEPLRVVGSGSKDFLCGGGGGGRPPRQLNVAEHRGVLDYRPEELVITARAGTPLKELEQTLAAAGQHLPFEPPRLHGGGTLGGAVACGLSGPGRPWRGAVRDAVLGVELVNGRGECLRFGGQVMKNVAGYDVSRLQAGAFGTLGVLLAVSVKVLPQPEVERTVCFETTAQSALARCRALARRPLPLSAACWVDGVLRLRLSGAEAAVRAAAAELGGELERDGAFWASLRDHRHPHLAEPGLWRCALPPAAGAPLDGCLINWAGAERWWRCHGPADAMRRQLAEAGGHGRPFDASFGARLGPHLSALEQRFSMALRRAFDPHGLFNPELAGAGGARHAD